MEERPTGKHTSVGDRGALGAEAVTGAVSTAGRSWLPRLAAGVLAVMNTVTTL